MEQKGAPRNHGPVSGIVDGYDVAEVRVDLVDMHGVVARGAKADDREQEHRHSQPRPVAVARHLESEVQLGQQLRRGRQVARLGARAIARPSARWVVRARRAQRQRVAHIRLRVGRRLLISLVWV